MNKKEVNIMNKRDWIILAILVNEGYKNHRTIAQKTGYSLGLINSSMKKLVDLGYIDSYYSITDNSRAYLETSKPQRAVILAAGLGMRMLPISRTPKCLLKINNQPMIERIIKQLEDVGISEIYVVTGYMMEKLEYLTDKFGVELIYDPDFTRRDSMHSLRLAADKLTNCYIVPSSVWFARNPFSTYEFFSWYAVSEYIDDDSYVRLNRKMELVYIDDESAGNSMIGLGYLRAEDAEVVRNQLVKLDGLRRYSREIWERALFVGNKMITYARMMLGQSAYEIKTYEDLRDLDSESQDLKSRHIDLISEVFGINHESVTDISSINKGMTNNLMRFMVDGSPYLLRIPGVGSNELTDRRQEAEVYNAIRGKGISDKVIYISGESGYKVTEYWENSRNCDSRNEDEVATCIRHLRSLHDLRLEVSHSFDILEKLVVYERLLSDGPSFTDYENTKERVLGLFGLMQEFPAETCLCHIDSVSDNFLFVGDEVHLIDWEYAGMCDPHIDIAMFCIYAGYDKATIDKVIDIYYEGDSSDLDRFKVYAYAAAAGLLWSLWSEYKGQFGVNYGQYAVEQYRYARNFSSHARRALESHTHNPAK